jgi:hypothetical protein
MPIMVWHSVARSAWMARRHIRASRLGPRHALRCDMNRPRFTIRRCIRVGGVIVAIASLGCSTSSVGARPGASSGPCDPLSPPPTTLGTILGVGKDSQSNFYVADEAPDGGGQDRVFVSHGSALDRQHVAGTGQSGGPPNNDYTLSFRDPFADASGTRALLIQIRGGTVTGMALGPGNSRSFLGAPGTAQVALTVVDAGVVAGFRLQNLPGIVQHVADVSNGNAIVVTAPMDAWGTSGFRLFYGPAGKMVEYPIVTYNADDYGQYVSFLIGGTTYNAFFNDPFEVDGGTGPGPGSLYTGEGGPDPACMTPPGALRLSSACQRQPHCPVLRSPVSVRSVTQRMDSSRTQRRAAPEAE